MSNGTPPQQQQRQTGPVEIIQAIGTVLAMLFAMYSARQADRAAERGDETQDRIQEVRKEQAAAVKTAVEVKEAVKERSARQDAQLDSIEKATSDTHETLGPQLWMTWRYLQSIAMESGNMSDIARANEAKKVYDSYRASKTPRPN